MTDNKMTIAIFLAAVTIGLVFTIGKVATSYGSPVSERFLERGTGYSEADLKALPPDQSRGYAFPVLFPLDLLLLMFLAGFFTLASLGAPDCGTSLASCRW